MKDCHIRDAAAEIQYFGWLESELAKGTYIDELDGAKKLNSFRYQLDLNRGLSFDSIPATGPNGAIIHYMPKEGTAR